MLDNNPSIQETETKPGPLSEFSASLSYIAIPSLKIKEYKIKIKWRIKSKETFGFVKL